ncbi:hypothetical protein PAKAF_01585 [Pseudomonas aeruginosa PAK]|nr:hypothetical protein PAKAF_01585 [Pseudomonas aeruginosa PAK]
MRNKRGCWHSVYRVAPLPSGRGERAARGSGQALPGYRWMVQRLHLVARRVEQVEAARAVAVVEGLVEQGHAQRLQVTVPGLQFLHAVDDEAVVIHGLQAVAGSVGAAEGKVVVAAGEIHQVFVGAVQHFHAQHVDIEALAFFQVGHQQGEVTQAVEVGGAGRAVGHGFASFFVYNNFVNLKQKEVSVYCIFIKTRLRPGCAEAFIDAIQVNAAASVSTEPGCLVFDVSRDRQDPDLVYLYEVYRDDAAYEAHTRTAHFRDSRPLVEPLILEQEVFESDALALNPLR